MTEDITTEQPPVIVIAPLGLHGTAVQLSVLFSGRVCAPLETSLSIERLIEVIGFVGGPVLCLDPELHHRLVTTGTEVVDVSGMSLDALLDGPTTEPVDPGGDADEAALLCFTSGSTGTPKGVLVPHSMLMDCAGISGVGPTDVVAITSPPSFFASMLQTLLALGTGGTGLYLDLSHNTPAQLRELALAAGVNQFTGTTTHVRELAKVSLDTPIRSLWGIDLGGEPTTREDLELFRRAFPAARVRNFYGSAETGRLATMDYAPTGELPPPGPIPAGHPGSGRLLGLFDEHGQQVADGGTGRIANLRAEPFLGYWRNPALTATRRLTTADGRLWTLSGDIGRFAPDGSLVVLGRTDDQLKIRGRFVNPRDIDTLLLADPRISAAITIPVPPEAPTQLRTIAVRTDPQDETVTEAALRHMLAQTLPLHALPRHIILVDAIPVTPRGKPDRDALLHISRVDSVPAGGHHEAGRSVMVDALLGIVRDHLDTDLGVDDDIFAMGADSLLAVEIIETIAEEFGSRITPAQLVANPTVGKLGVLLREGVEEEPHPGLITLFESDHPTTAYWILGTPESFGPARLARRTAPIRSSSIRVTGTDRGALKERSITATGEWNADIVAATRSDRTVVIGYSGGTVLAHETACALQRRSTPPDLLILVDPPSVEDLDRFRRNRRLEPLRRRARNTVEILRGRRRLRRPFDTSDPDEQRRRVVRQLAGLTVDHSMGTYEGSAVVILTTEYIEAGGTQVTDSGLTRPIERIQIEGVHRGVFVDAGPLADAINGVLAQRGLLRAN